MSNNRARTDAARALEAVARAALQPGADPKNLQAALENIRPHLPPVQDGPNLLPDTIQPLLQAAEAVQVEDTQGLWQDLAKECAALEGCFADPLKDRWQSEHKAETEDLTWLVPNWIPHATVSVLSGQGGTGKSRIALQLAIAVALGWDDFLTGDCPDPGQKPMVDTSRSGPVVYAAWETGRVAWNKRRDAILGLFGKSEPGSSSSCLRDLNNRLHFVNLAGLGGLWGVEFERHMATMGGMLPLGDALLRQVADHKATLLVIDPVAAAFLQNENDRALVRSFLTALRAWAEAEHCAVLLIQHPAKSGSEAQSGSTDWRNGVHAVLELKNADSDSKDAGHRILRLDKANEGIAGLECGLRWGHGPFVACPLPEPKRKEPTKPKGKAKASANGARQPTDTNPDELFRGAAT